MPATAITLPSARAHVPASWRALRTAALRMYHCTCYNIILYAYEYIYIYIYNLVPRRAVRNSTFSLGIYLPIYLSIYLKLFSCACP